MNFLLFLPNIHEYFVNIVKKAFDQVKQSNTDEYALIGDVKGRWGGSVCAMQKIGNVIILLLKRI